jgi:ArsR family transcriptional regulator
MSGSKAFDAELFFSALADRTRLRLLNVMRGGEVCVCFLADTLQTNDPKISRHLAYLRRADLVTARRDGKWMHYAIKEPADVGARNILRSTLELIESEPEMRKDRQRLTRVCCPPLPVKIGKAG